MKAILVPEFGGPEVLKLEDVPTPRPAAGQVLVRIRAAGVNPLSHDGPVRLVRFDVGTWPQYSLVCGVCMSSRNGSDARIFTRSWQVGNSSPIP